MIPSPARIAFSVAPLLLPAIFPEVNKKRLTTVGLLVFSLVKLFAAEISLWEQPDPLLQSFLKEKTKNSAQIAAGLVDATGRRLVFPSQNCRSDTVFEIGSVTKVFTALLLADAVARNEMGLDDPIDQYLPASVRAPSKDGQKITLLHLAQHTSGLSRLPANFAPRDPANPYRDYSLSQLYAFLSACRLSRVPGEQYEYSNVGAGLLGHVLARHQKNSYEELVVKRICQPLGMTETRVTLNQSMRSRLAAGHDAGGNQVSNWDIPTLAGAGALRSTPADMTSFLAACMGLTNTWLQPLVAFTQSRRRPAEGSMEIALAWHLLKKESSEIWWHNGQTGGYHSFFGFDPHRKRGVVLLCSAAIDIDSLAVQILTSR